MTEGGRLEFRSAELLAAIATLSASAKGGRLLHISFAEGVLTFAAVSSRYGIAAAGEWSGRASVRAKYFKTMLQSRDDWPTMVTLTATDEAIQIDRYTFPCSW